MTIISFPLSDERLAQLRIWAQQAGVAPKNSCAAGSSNFWTGRMSSSGRPRPMFLKRKQSFIGGWHDPLFDLGGGVGEDRVFPARAAAYHALRDFGIQVDKPIIEIPLRRTKEPLREKGKS